MRFATTFSTLPCGASGLVAALTLSCEVRQQQEHGAGVDTNWLNLFWAHIPGILLRWGTDFSFFNVVFSFYGWNKQIEGLFGGWAEFGDLISLPQRHLGSVGWSQPEGWICLLWEAMVWWSDQGMHSSSSSWGFQRALGSAYHTKHSLGIQLCVLSTGEIFLWFQQQCLEIQTCLHHLLGRVCKSYPET